MKQYKCGYSHCAHENGIVLEGEAVKIKTRRWHKDCYELQGLIADIEEEYIQHISQSVPVAYLRKVINDIVFGKKLENSKVEKWKSNLEAGRYLSFCIKYAIEEGIPLTHPPGLYYLIDNAKVKKAYQKEEELRVQKKMAESMKDRKSSAEVPVSTPTKTPTSQGSTMGFGSILKGGK
jgi:hypothetical protein